MHPRDVLDPAHRRNFPLQRLEALMLQNAVDGSESVGTFGMADRGQMVEIGGVMQVEGCQERFLACAVSGAWCLI